MIDFEKIPEVVIPHLKGGEGFVRSRAFVDEKNRIAKNTLEPGASIGLHTHENDCEIVYVISGVMTTYLNGVKEVTKAGQCHYCPKGSSHSIANETKEDLVCLCVVSKL
jgi:quercetin dioxygenase-like cupin family protein